MVSEVASNATRKTSLTIESILMVARGRRCRNDLSLTNHPATAKGSVPHVATGRLADQTPSHRLETNVGVCPMYIALFRPNKKHWSQQITPGRPPASCRASAALAHHCWLHSAACSPRPRPPAQPQQTAPTPPCSATPWGPAQGPGPTSAPPARTSAGSGACAQSATDQQALHSSNGEGTGRR